jgi:hypothetical protein
MDASSDNPSDEAGEHLPQEEVKTNASNHVRQPVQQAGEEDEGGEGEGVDVQDLTEEDAESLVGVSMNWAATHLGSTKSTGSGTRVGTVELEGGTFFDSDEDALPPPGKLALSSEKASSETPIVDLQPGSNPPPSQTCELKLYRLA